MKKLAIVWMVTFLFLAGCETSMPKTTKKDQQLDSAAGMVKYLQKQNLPAVKAVGVWQNQYGAGLKITTEHYTINSTLLDPLMLCQVPGFMESAYQAYQKQVPEPIETNSKFTVYIFANRAQWEKFTRDFAGEQSEVFCKIKAGAYYLNGACVSYNIGRERTFSVLGHEGWHQFNSRHFKYRLPSWLDEGLAMQFESSRYADGLFYFEPTENFNRLAGLKTTLAKESVIPIEKLLTINPGEVVSFDDSAAVTAFYSEAYAMVRFLREENGGENFDLFQQMVLDGLNGQWPLSIEAQKMAIDRNMPLTVQWNRLVGMGLFKYYIDDDFVNLQEEYLAFCRKIVYHIQVNG